MKDASAFQERIRRLQDEMIQSEVDLTIIAPTANMRYLTGFAPLMDERFCALLVSQNSFSMVVPDLNADQVETHTGLTVIRWKDELGPNEAIDSAISQLAVPSNSILAADNSMRAEHLLLIQDRTMPESSLPAGELMSRLRITKTQDEIIKATSVADRLRRSSKEEISIDELGELYKEMADAVSLLEFERAAEIRDKIKTIKRRLEMKQGRKYQTKRHTQK